MLCTRTAKGLFYSKSFKFVSDSEGCVINNDFNKTNKGCQRVFSIMLIKTLKLFLKSQVFYFNLSKDIM